ncbi:hypothetical protein TSUD_276470 [Trifolium subterraneum]|uniref:Uncharacterized protein n=1 Tax=Trifolium subterraneum TaxID=3900 RepID=A0A2Z6P9W2_TRISU|nr:hypothetical protein TSUD_276470 [Trifolium subterraneum]
MPCFATLETAGRDKSPSPTVSRPPAFVLSAVPAHPHSFVSSSCAMASKPGADLVWCQGVYLHALNFEKLH